MDQGRYWGLVIHYLYKKKKRYWGLVKKLNYLTITHPVLQSPCDSHRNAVFHVLIYLKGSLGQG